MTSKEISNVFSVGIQPTRWVATCDVSKQNDVIARYKMNVETYLEKNPNNILDLWREAADDDVHDVSRAPCWD